jgi:hypothetical protein
VATGSGRSTVPIGPFELIKDMRSARANGDSLLALAVIQQCTRKNVGGVMSEDLFRYCILLLLYTVLTVML